MRGSILEVQHPSNKKFRKKEHFYPILSWGPYLNRKDKKLGARVGKEHTKLVFCAENIILYIQREKGTKRGQGRNY